MPTSPSLAIKLFGTEEPVPPMRTLRAGPLSAELDGGNLRFIRLNGIEALRYLGFIVRDKDWGTYQPVIANLKIDEGREGFTVSYDATCKDSKQELRYQAKIVGKADGSLRFEGVSTAATDFLTNRCGFVVLHPIIGVAGRPVEVLHVDGTVEHSTFPELVDPLQPFKNLRALTHEVLPGVKVTCRMEGDTFETEDHRQWNDASYKTYVRPIGLPWPFWMKAGEVTEQAVTLSVSGALPKPSASGVQPIKIKIGEPAGRMPRIGLGVEPQYTATALAHADLVKKLGPQELVCWFDASAGHGRAELEAYRALAEASGAGLVLEAILPCQDYRAELRAIAAQAADAGVKFAAVSVSPACYLKSIMPGSQWPAVPPLEDIYAATRQAFPGVTLGGGMFSYFPELNRKRPPTAFIDYITHTSNVITHASDDITVTENLEALPDVIKTCRAFAGGKPYRVGPSAIAMRDNAYGASTMPNPDNKRIAMVRMDPRQRGLLNAAWNLGYAAHMARGGIEVITLQAPVGEFGLIYHKMAWPQPWFDAANAQVYPAFHVVAGLAAAAGNAMLGAASSLGHDVECLAYRGHGATTLWVANLTGGERAVEIAGLPAGQVMARVLDAASFETCVMSAAGFDAIRKRIDASRIVLAPYAVIRLDVAG